MNILTRYISREFLKIFILTLLSLILIYLSIDLFEKIRKFIEYKPPLRLILLYFIFKLPRIIFQIMPISVLLSTLITIGIFCKNNEVTAMRSCGLSIMRISYPFLYISLLISVIHLILNLSFIPVISERSDYIKEVLIEKREAKTYFRQNRIWFRQKDHIIINAEVIDPKLRKMSGVKIYNLGNDFSIPEVTEAKELLYENKKWQLVDGKNMKFLQNGSIETRSFDREYVDINKDFSEFNEVKREVENMKFSYLKRYIDLLTRDGYNPDRYLTDLYSRISFPLVNFVMALIGIPFGLREIRGRGVALSLGVGLLIAFSYWVIYSLSIALGHGGIIPPLISAWIANILFLSVGILLIMNIKQ